MVSETLLHIQESLSADETEELLLCFGNRPEGIHAHLHTDRPHMLFVAYDPDELCPHNLVAIAGEHGVHAHVVDL